jgi:hypothetical protein
MTECKTAATLHAPLGTLSNKSPARSFRLHTVQNPGGTSARGAVALAACRRHKVFEGGGGVGRRVEVGGRLGGQAFGAEGECGVVFVRGVLLGVSLLRRKY